MKGAKDSAFPLQPIGPDGSPWLESRGITKREYFAAAALTGMLANSTGVDRAWEAAKKESDDKDIVVKIIQNYFAEMSVQYADALLLDIALNDARDLKRALELKCDLDARDSHEF